jgi:hypothetical protein
MKANLSVALRPLVYSIGILMSSCISPNSKHTANSDSIRESPKSLFFATPLPKDLAYDPQSYKNYVSCFDHICKTYDFFKRDKNDINGLLFYSQTPVTCSEFSFLTYGALSDDGLEPYFIRLSGPFSAHMLNLVKVDGTYASFGINTKDLIYPGKHKTLDSLAQNLYENYDGEYSSHTVFELKPSQVYYSGAKIMSPLVLAAKKK